MIKRAILFLLIAAGLASALFLSQRRREPLKVSGFVEAEEIRVGSRVGGRVARVAVAEGAMVKQGETLFELEPFDLLERRAEAQAQLAAREAESQRLVAGFRAEEIAQSKARRDQLAATLEKLVAGPRKQEIAAAEAHARLAQAQLDLSQNEFDRAKSLFERKATSAEEMDQATNQLKAAQSTLAARQEELALLTEGTRKEDLDAARAQLEETEQAWKLHQAGYRAEEIAGAKAAADAARAALAAIDRQIGELSVRSPTAARVEAVDLHPGDLVGPSAPAISLMDLSHLWVRAYVPENRINIEIGQKLAVTVDSFPGERFMGHATFIARQAEFTPGNVQTPEERSKQVFRIKVALDEGLEKLRPGMAADVWLKPGNEK